MFRFSRIILLTIVLAVHVVTPALASGVGPPVGTCPPGFEMHEFMDHAEHPEHHIGLTEDLNQDGFICVKHLSNGLHVHMDNVLP
jgi:hypothetical protein